MPRLSTPLLCHAYSINPLLILILRTCRDLQSARNELRWLREGAIKQAQAQNRHDGAREGWRTILRQSCLDRSRGRPLQYILGNQPFGDLDILCKPGVLIPRPETENYTSHLARRLLEGIRRHGANPNKPLRILDLGTGTGCIPLLLHASLSKLIPNIRIVGIDISPKAIELARRNVRWNIAQLNLDISARRQVSFQLGDILEMSKECKNTICTTPILQTDWDVVTSNPPYISPKAFRTTSRSVRNFEPGLALVPPPQNGIKLGETTELGHATNEGDTLYPGILDIATKVNTKLAVLEVSDLEQAIRVASIALDTGHWDAVEVWRDSLNFNGPQASEGKAQPNQLVVEGHKIILWGDGNARAVVCRKNY